MEGGLPVPGIRVRQPRVSYDAQGSSARTLKLSHPLAHPMTDRPQYCDPGPLCSGVIHHHPPTSCIRAALVGGWSSTEAQGINWIRRHDHSSAYMDHLSCCTASMVQGRLLCRRLPNAASPASLQPVVTLASCTPLCTAKPRASAKSVIQGQDMLHHKIEFKACSPPFHTRHLKGSHSPFQTRISKHFTIIHPSVLTVPCDAV